MARVVGCLLAILAVELHAAPGLPQSTYVGDFPCGCQAYTFIRYTAFEAIEKTSQAGGKTIEFSFQQKFSPEHPDTQLNEQLPEPLLKQLKEKLKKENIRPVSAYFSHTIFQRKDPETELRKVFDFAKSLELVSLTGEPPASGLDLIEKFCKEYDIRFCLHNHRQNPKDPNYKYWDPQHNVQLMKNRDRRMGFCLDTGHLVRSGLDPLAALKLYEGRLFSLHLKDPASATGDDTIFGQGVADVKGILQELRRQKFDGFISIEYENNWTNSVPDVRRCVEFVRKH